MNFILWFPCVRRTNKQCNSQNHSLEKNVLCWIFLCHSYSVLVFVHYLIIILPFHESIAESGAGKFIMIGASLFFPLFHSDWVPEFCEQMHLPSQVFLNLILMNTTGSSLILSLLSGLASELCEILYSSSCKILKYHLKSLWITIEASPYLSHPSFWLSVWDLWMIIIMSCWCKTGNCRGMNVSHKTSPTNDAPPISLNSTTHTLNNYRHPRTIQYPNEVSRALFTIQMWCPEHYSLSNY